MNAVAWNRQHITEGKVVPAKKSFFVSHIISLDIGPTSYVWHPCAAYTKEIILGTENGQLYEVSVEEKDKKEKYIKFLFELNEVTEEFTGLQVLDL